MKIIAITNNKGGVGKTTTAANLAAALARTASVLLVDLDDQGNLSFQFAQSPSDYNVGTFLLAPVQEAATWPFRAVGASKSELRILASTDRMGEYQQQLLARDDYPFLLRDRLRALPPDRFTYVVLDCPPSLLDGMTYNAFCAADAFLVPAEPEPFAVRGLARVMDIAQAVRERTNPSLAFLGFVFTRFNPRQRGQLRQQLLAQVQARYGSTSILPHIRQDTALAEAQAERLDVFSYAPSSRGAADYEALATAIRQRLAVPLPA